jgi:GNAT superfamily N-acetyltransferase
MSDPLLTCRLADWSDPADAAAAIALLDAYARDPMGGGVPLGDYARTHLAQRLAAMPQAFTVLALVDGMPAGLANCFEGLSTFSCQAVVNVHDFAVLPQWRGRGVAKALMASVEAQARLRGACKLTLEVLQGNTAARSLYAQAGFVNYQLDPAMGSAEFLQKYL